MGNDIRKRQSPLGAFVAWTNKNPGPCFVIVVILTAASGIVFLIVNGPPAPSVKEQRYDVYSPVMDVACPIDSAFLDASPIAQPSRFRKLTPGTEWMLCAKGGNVGHPWWGITDGNETVYVYHSELKRNFTIVATLDEDGKRIKSAR